MIDYDFHRDEAARLRAEAYRDAGQAVWRFLLAAAWCCRAPNASAKAIDRAAARKVADTMITLAGSD